MGQSSSTKEFTNFVIRVVSFYQVVWTDIHLTEMIIMYESFQKL